MRYERVVRLMFLDAKSCEVMRSGDFAAAVPVSPVRICPVLLLLWYKIATSTPAAC